jgi:hypothetical protein
MNVALNGCRPELGYNRYAPRFDEHEDRGQVGVDKRRTDQESEQRVAGRELAT